MRQPNVVGIIGCDYCGSTTVNALFNCIPGVLAVGESHWIIDHAWSCRNCRNVPCGEHQSCEHCDSTFRCQEHRECKACHTSPCPLQSRCRECGTEPCPVFTDELLERLRKLDNPKADWWRTIASSAAVSHLVSADKRAAHYERLGIPNYLLLLTKDYREHVFSFAKRQQRDFETNADGKVSDEVVELGINWLVRGYRGLIRWTQEHAFVVRVESIEEILADPQGRMRAICRWCGIKTRNQNFDYANHEQHYIGGNFSLKSNPQYGLKHSNTRWMTALNPDQQQRIVSDKRLKRITQDLQSLSAQTRWKPLRLFSRLFGK